MVIVAKISFKGLNLYEQTIIKKIISIFSITSLLSKNENRDRVVFKCKQELDKTDKLTSQNQISTTKKQTRKEKSAHKLHSLHRSYNKINVVGAKMLNN